MQDNTSAHTTEACAKESQSPTFERLKQILDSADATAHPRALMMASGLTRSVCVAVEVIIIGRRLGTLYELLPAAVEGSVLDQFQDEVDQAVSSLAYAWEALEAECLKFDRGLSR